MFKFDLLIFVLQLRELEHHGLRAQFAADPGEIAASDLDALKRIFAERYSILSRKFALPFDRERCAAIAEEGASPLVVLKREEAVVGGFQVHLPEEIPAAWSMAGALDKSAFNGRESFVQAFEAYRDLMRARGRYVAFEAATEFKGLHAILRAAGIERVRDVFQAISLVSGGGRFTGSAVAINNCASDDGEHGNNTAFMRNFGPHEEFGLQGIYDKGRGDDLVWKYLFVDPLLLNSENNG